VSEILLNFPPPFTGGDSDTVFADRKAVEGAPSASLRSGTSPVNGGGKMQH